MGQTGPGYIEHCLAEYRWCSAELAASDRHYVTVPAIPLEEPSAPGHLAELAADPRVRGIRQIANKLGTSKSTVHRVLADLKI